MTKDDALQLWYRALDAEIGIIITIRDRTDLESARTTLYSARKDAADERLLPLAVCLPGDAPNEIMIVKKSAELN